MNNEFFDALEIFEKEKGISQEYLLEKIKTAISIAIKKDYNLLDNFKIELDNISRKFKVSIIKKVVVDVEEKSEEISLENALSYNKRARLGETVEIKLDTKQLGRIAAQTAKSVIKQSIRDAERVQLLEQYNEKVDKIISGVVLKIDPRNGNLVVESEKHEITLFANEQIPGETFIEGDRIKVYVTGVISTEKKCNMKISRVHKDFVKKLFELEVPEINDGVVTVKAVSREAGSRSKIAVYTLDCDVDPVGSCIGSKGMRILNIVKELNGEKIDIIKYNEAMEEFISESLSPSKVISTKILDEEEKTCRVIVPKDQLSLAIGNRGQNAKLAARLTGYKIDIISDEMELENIREAEDLRSMEAAAEGKPVVEESAAEGEPVIEKSAAEGEPVIEESAVEGEPVVVEESAAEGEPVIEKSAAEGEPVIEESAVEGEPVVVEEEVESKNI